MAYFKFYLVPNQTPPKEGSTGLAMTDGGIVYIGDKWPDKSIEAHEMSADEIAEYEIFLKYNQSGAMKYGLEFSDVWPTSKIDAAITAVKAKLDDAKTAITRA